MKQLHVGIDITALLFNRGVSRYTSNLVRALSEYQKHAVYGFGTSFRNADTLIQRGVAAGLSKKAIHINKMPLRLQELAWQWGKQPITHYLPHISVFHSWDWLQPPDKNIALVSTIHDLAMLKFPETAHPNVLKHHKRSWHILKERQAQIIAVSHSTKRDIIELLQIPAHRVTVIHEAIPTETIAASVALTEDSFTHTKRKYALDTGKPFILAVGTREPRKNLLKLIEAWKPLAKDVSLVIAGEAGWDRTENLQVSELHQKNIKMLGTVSQEELMVLYAEAELLAYPSLDEGFGLPILEAFHHGTPVVTSNISAMPEVAGNAAELVDPHSVESIRTGLHTILGENHTQQKRRLQRMIIRLQMFSWKQVAIETTKVYQKAFLTKNT